MSCEQSAIQILHLFPILYKIMQPFNIFQQKWTKKVSVSNEMQGT